MRIFCISILLFWVLSGHAQYTKLHDFIVENTLMYPRGELVSDGTWLYGTTTSGPSSSGTVFKIKPDGTGLTILVDFKGTNGANPYSGLIIAGSVLYGVTRNGGINNQGVLFRINTDGTGYSSLVNFDGPNFGAAPMGALTYSGTTLYGTTYSGGTYDYGVIFKVEKDGSGFVKLLDFDGNTKGANPARGVIISGTTLYGTTVFGGTDNKGVVFKIETNGSGFSKILDFNNSNGANPWSPLILSSAILYGATVNGGSGYGVVFKIKPDGSGYTKLLEFDNIFNGAAPYGLTISGSGLTLYGMTYYAGTQNRGVIFKITTSGSYTKLLDFTGSNGEYPIGSVIEVGSKLFGMTSMGGYGFGTIFSINDDGSDYTKLLDFSKAPLGAYPGWANFVSDGTWLYSTTSNGGLGYGTIYKIKPDGSSFTKLFDFDRANGETPTNLILSGSVLYGTTNYGGVYGMGTIFSLNTSGTGFAKLLDFDGTNKGSCPNKLNLIGTTFYGSTSRGGGFNLGVIYKINTVGTGFTKLLDFDGANYGSLANSELVLSGTKLYGTTLNGGVNDMGVIFRIDVNGTGFTKMADFNGSNGSHPYSSLTLDGTTLFGATFEGGSNNLGAIFRINTDGTNFVRIYDFDGDPNGAWPMGSLALSDSKLFGIANWGGSNYGGVLFRINADGSNYTRLVDFKDEVNGRRSTATPLILDGTLYAQTNEGGSTQGGTVFKYDLKPANAGAITGSSIVCSGQTAITYSVSSITNAATYTWTLPAGATGSSTTNSISVTFGTGSVSGNISVKGSNNYSDGAIASFPVTINNVPSAPGIITGTPEVNQGQSGVSYSVPAIASATDYSWNYSGTGASIVGSGNSVSLNFSGSATSGNLTVYGTNTCGNGPVSTSYLISIRPTSPIIGTITQPTCVSLTGSVILNGLPSSGNWTITRLPGGITVSGTGTSITITGIEPGVHTFIVTNSSGITSPESENIRIVAKKGIIPEIKVKWHNVLICYNLKDSIKSYQWYKDNSAITNASSQFLNTNNQPGIYKVETVDKENCKNSSNIIPLSSNKSLEVYPNPASESFALRISDEVEGNVLVSIMNTSGIKITEIQTGDLNRELLKNIPVSNLDNGIYIVRVLLNNNDMYYTKIVVMK